VDRQRRNRQRQPPRGGVHHALDWVSRTTALERKPVAVLGATTGSWGTRLAQSVLRHTLAAMEARVMPQPMLFLARADGSFDAHGQADEELRGRLASFAASFAEWIEFFAGREALRSEAS